MVWQCRQRRVHLLSSVQTRFVKMEENKDKVKASAKCPQYTMMKYESGWNLFKKSLENSFRKGEQFVPTMCQECIPEVVSPQILTENHGNLFHGQKSTFQHNLQQPELHLFHIISHNLTGQTLTSGKHWLLHNLISIFSVFES